MEVLGIILVISVVAILLYREHQSGQSARPPKTTSISRPPSVHSSLPQAPSRQASRFDETSAQHLHHTHILTGAAWVTDGDTITIKKTQIRLYGIDAPELNHPYGQKAKWALHRLCKGHAIRAEITDEDDYGRTVARCYLPDGRDLSAEMVKQGLALDWPKYSGGKYKNLETSNARKKLYLADARQKGRMHVWANFEAKQSRSSDR